jgi:hypothetical protein
MLSFDKLLHFMAGAAVFMLMLPFVGPLAAMAAVVFVGAGKEVYDYFNPEKHTSDLLDIVATVAGGLILFVFV